MKVDIATLISTDRKIYTKDKRFKVGTTNSNARKKQMNLPATVSTKLQKSAAFILLSLALEIPSLPEECQTKESCLFPCSLLSAKKAQNTLKFTHLGGCFSVFKSNTAVKQFLSGC
ncbi:hypothetical protein [Nostoc sp. XA010]|uniref:hypothetical protein n=1 Tax=Nostoc sp. XA010 TaxID=2780407 RepID=UPI001E5022B4|nr:hypothetical protein [Nostoc sp. XA010]